MNPFFTADSCSSVPGKACATGNLNRIFHVEFLGELDRVLDVSRLLPAGRGMEVSVHYEAEFVQSLVNWRAALDGCAFLDVLRIC